jgi:hypothetical protein
MLAGLLFLCHLCLYYEHLNQLPLTNIYCDNLGLIKKVNRLLTFRLATTQAALHSEYDMLATIHKLLGDLPITPTIDHVKGHQDDKVPYAALPLPAQLNVDADVLAIHELLYYPTQCTHVSLLPAAQVQLNVAGRTITRKLGPDIRQRAKENILSDPCNLLVIFYF